MDKASEPAAVRVVCRTVQRAVRALAPTDRQTTIRQEPAVLRLLREPAHQSPRSAIETGLALLRATGNLAGQQSWIPIGVGVHSGEAFIGTVGRAGGLIELTAIGESINVAARLASVAAAGELVCSEAAYVASGLTHPGERREVVLKGVSAAVPVRVLRTG
jgi:class 3 adenylate cyclase